MTMAQQTIALQKYNLGGNIYRARYAIDGMAFPVELTDVRLNYGRLQFQICPIRGGSGRKWTIPDKLSVIDDDLTTADL